MQCTPRLPSSPSPYIRGRRLELLTSDFSPLLTYDIGTENALKSPGRSCLWHRPRSCLLALCRPSQGGPGGKSWGVGGVHIPFSFQWVLSAVRADLSASVEHVVEPASGLRPSMHQDFGSVMSGLFKPMTKNPDILAFTSSARVQQ